MSKSTLKTVEKTKANLLADYAKLTGLKSFSGDRRSLRRAVARQRRISLSAGYR